jgi:Flp pilus assembly protein TadD
MDLEVRRALAEANLAAGKPAEAIRLLQGKGGSHPTVALILGRAQHKAGDSAGAMATLKPLVDQLPSTADQIGDPRPASAVATEYASLLVEGGKVQEAMPILDKATRLNPRNQEAWRTLAKAYEASGKKSEAAQATAKADELAKPPAAAASQAAAGAAPAGSSAPAGLAPLSANIQEAMRLTAQGKTEEALAAVHREVVANPADQRARGLEVEGLLALRRLDEALRSTEAAVKVDPQNPDYYYLRGAVRMAMKNLPQAEADFRRALELAPEHTAAMSDLAVLLIETGKKAEARSLLENVLKIYPNDPNATANLAALNAEDKH